MPNRLHRYYGAGYSHFITTRCYQRLPLLTNPRNRGLFLRVLELVRRRYRFVVFGYVVMPEHVQRFRRLVTRYEYQHRELSWHGPSRLHENHAEVCVSDYSYRSATMGSTFAARRAGT
jgi:REP element-mobilizing transposase RayT